MRPCAPPIPRGTSYTSGGCSDIHQGPPKNGGARAPPAGGTPASAREGHVGVWPPPRRAHAASRCPARRATAGSPRGHALHPNGQPRIMNKPRPSTSHASAPVPSSKGPPIGDPGATRPSSRWRPPRVPCGKLPRPGHCLVPRRSLGGMPPPGGPHGSKVPPTYAAEWLAWALAPAVFGVPAPKWSMRRAQPTRQSAGGRGPHSHIAYAKTRVMLGHLAARDNRIMCS